MTDPSPPLLTPDRVPLHGRRVLVMGLGLAGGGVAVTRWLAREGARVTVTDLRPERDLRESVEALAGLPVELRLGGHREEDFRGTDLVVRSPAVPHDNPFLAVARGAGVPIDTEMNLFWKRCRAPILAVTGSNGKTTTTALCGEVLRRLAPGLPPPPGALAGRAAAPRKVWVGGNIGIPLVEHADAIDPGDLVVLEISSFQLEDLASLRRSPRVAAVMNLTPNHLDRHGTMEAYVEAKRQIVRDQGPGDAAVLNADDPRVWGWAAACRSRVRPFTLRAPGAGQVGREGEVLRAEVEGGPFRIDVTGRLLPGVFNLQNMVAAAAATWELAGHAAPAAWAAAAGEAFRSFPGVEHRLEFVLEAGGARYYNDSIATNPESTLAALDALPGPFVLIAGGYDKKLPFDALGRAVAAKVRDLILLGQTADAIEAAVRAAGGGPRIRRVATLAEAVEAAVGLARAGDHVLLSPACASFDQFRNFAERGRLFKRELAAQRGRAAAP
jgi:UDP-N-acetylmuramoylalanine--D-glutamate ligase